MTLDEAIKQCEEVAETKKQESIDAETQGCDRYALKCEKCASEHRQLAEWLKLLKRILESGDCNECGIKKVCNVRPEWGEQVRYNCPMFVRGEQ